LLLDSPLAAPGSVGLAAAPAFVHRLQRSVGNQAVLGALRTGQRPATAASTAGLPAAAGVVQRAGTTQILRRKTRLRADRGGAPDPDTKQGSTIPTGAAVKVDDPAVTNDIWTRVSYQGRVGWMRTAKLKDVETMAERVVEGILMMQAGGHVPRAGQLSAAAFQRRMTALPQAEYTEMFRRRQRRPLANNDQAGIGFFDPGARQIFVLDTALGQGTVIHEMFHFLSNNAATAAGGRRLDEGLTEFLRMQHQPAGGPPVHQNYLSDYNAINELSTLAGAAAALTAVTAAYFTGDLSSLGALVDAHIKPKSLARYCNRISGRQEEARFAAVKGLTGATPWARRPFDVWCAFGKADFGDVPYNLLAGVPAYEDDALAAPTP
jgi:hypothetical protein